MALPLEYAHYTNGATRPFAAVDPILTPTSLGDAIGQIISFLARREAFTVGVADTRYFPFSAICRLQMRYPGDPSTYQGTGFYIGPNLILTAGHNLIDNGNKASSIVVEPGRNDGFTFPSFTVNTSALEIHPKYETGTDEGYDMGVIHVENGPPNGDYFQLINYSPVAETPLAVCGYGFGGAAQDDRQHLDIDRIRRLVNNDQNVEYNLQTLGGNSGSPAFVDFSNNQSGGYLASDLLVMGIHRSASDSTHNRAVLLTPEKIDWANGGGRMSVSQSLAQLGGLPLMKRPRNTLGGLPLQVPGHTAIRPAPAMAQQLARPLSRSWIVTDEAGGMSIERRTFGHATHDLSGKTTLSVRVPNMPEGGSVRWHIPDATDRTRVLFETGNTTSHSTGGTSVTLCALAGGHAAVDCMVKDASGTTVESNKYLVSAPQFVMVTIDPSVDTYLAQIGLTTRKADLMAEMKTMMRDQYASVNMRLVFPGDTLPLHLGLQSNPDFPGGVKTMPSVYYVNVIGDENFLDPERTRNTGIPSGYELDLIGRNHGIGQMDAPMNEHAMSRILIHRFGAFFPDMTPIVNGLTAGGMPASDIDLATTLFGRVTGYISAHELGHFMLNQLFGHDPEGGLMGGGSHGITRVSGMSATGSTPILTDAGYGAATGLSHSMLQTFENVLAINPPLDAAGRRDRGRVGSFSLSRHTQGWVNSPVTRTLSGETVHLPGAEVLEGWRAEAFITAIEFAVKTVMSTNPLGLLLSQFVSVSAILDICDAKNITLGFGPSLGFGVQGGISGGYGIIFAPGRRIGFYGTYSSIIGWIYSAGLMAQLTMVNGGPEVFGGESRLLGVTVETVGWFDTGLFGVPVGLHRIYNLQDQPIGYTFEAGVGVGVPIISLIEAYAQSAETVTTFNAQPQGQALSAAVSATDARSEAINRAVASGATPSEAAAFVNALFM